MRWLVQEMKDLLDDSSVGLYEFIWALRSRYPNLDASESALAAQAALTELLDDSNIAPVWQRWPHEDIGRTHSGPLPAGAWDDIPEDRIYLAVDRR